MFAQERHNAIKKIIRERKRMSFADLQKRIKFSSATLRRDLAELEKSGDVIRVHGGLLDPAYVRAETSLGERLLKNGAAKKIIAKKAADLIPPGSSVYVDAGSTCLEAGKFLLGRKDIRLVTHSVALIAAALQGEAEIICIGGELRRVSGALVGGPALGVLAKLRVDFALIGASGLSEEGCSTTELSEAEIKRSILKRSKQSFLLADVTKWQNPSTVCFAEWSGFTAWIADEKFSSADYKRIRSFGITVNQRVG